MTEISNNSNYDLITHTPIITLDYIKDTTGIDLRINGDVIIGSIEGKVKMLTLQAKAFLFNMKIYETQRVMEYLIATNIEWRRAFEYYACMYVIQSAYYNPDWEKTPKDILAAINGSVLKANYFTQHIIYEVETSTLEW